MKKYLTIWLKIIIMLRNNIEISIHQMFRYKADTYSVNP